MILPHAIAYNAAAVPQAMAALQRALGRDDAALALFELNQQLGAPTSLVSLGMPETGIALAAELATQNAYWNPRAIERAAITELLQRAHAGLPPV